MSLRMTLFAISLIAFASLGSAQEADTKRLQELLASFPTPAKKDGKLADVDKEAIDKAVAQMMKDLDRTIPGLVDLLAVKGGDVQARHALHAIVIRANEETSKTVMHIVADNLMKTLKPDRPKEIQAFVIGQVQLIGDDRQAEKLGALLLDADLAESAAQALLAIKHNAAPQFRAALAKVSGKQRALIAHGLGTLKDKASAEPLRKLLDDDDRTVRLTAAWALANLPDAEAADRLLKMADAAKGYERASAADSCLLLADNLVAAGDKSGARQIFTRLHESRTEASERFVKEAAAKGLAATK